MVMNYDGSGDGGGDDGPAVAVQAVLCCSPASRA